MGAGHASTAIGYAVGIKEAMLRGGCEDGRVVAVVGDGAMTGGVAFEAVSQAGGLGTPIVVILNDNGMSIAPNVGALSRYMNRVRLDPGLWEAREGVEEKLTKLPAGIGAAFERLGPRFKESVKAFWAPGLWWEELDWAYLGVIDGHDVRAMRRALRAAFDAERPVVIHCATVKGKGFAPAEDGGLEGMEKWHAAKPKSISQRRPAPSRPSSPAPPQYTQVFGDAMVRECERDPRVIGITAAMNSGTGLSILQKAMPDRYFDVGIAEQQARAVRGRRRFEWAAAGVRDLLDLPAARVRPDRPRRLPAAAAGDVLHGSRGAGRRRRADAPRRLRHRLPARAAAHHADGAARRGDARAHAPHGAAVDGPAAVRYPRGAGVGVELPTAAGAAAGRHRRDPARGRAGRADRLRHRRREGAGRRRPAGRARARRDGRRCSLREAAGRAAAGLAGRRPRPAGDGRGGRAGGRIRLCRVGVPVRGGRRRAADPARRAARIATSPTALRRCCTKKSGSRPSGSPSASRRPCSTRASPCRHLNARSR